MYYSWMIIIKYRDQPKKKAELFWGRKKEEKKRRNNINKTIEGANITINIVVRATTIHRERGKKYQKEECERP
jgi:hypothetical protein